MDPKELVTWAHIFHFSNGRVPTFEEVLRDNKLTKEELLELLPGLNKGLESRGIEQIVEPKQLEKRRPVAELDPYFVLAVDLLTDPMDKRSKSAKLKAAQISSLKFDKLLEKANHFDYWQKKSKKMVTVAQTYGDVALVRNVENGDLQSIKYFYEMTGKYRGQEETITNLMVLIGSLMEILARYVDGPTLSVIAEEFEHKLQPKELTASG